MKYELANIEGVVADVIQAMNARHFQLSDATTIEQFLLSELARIKKVFGEVVICEQGCCQQYFSFHQQGIIALIDQIFAARKLNPERKYLPLLQSLVGISEKLLSLIHVQYSKFFDYSLIAPRPMLEQLKNRSSKFLSVLIEVRNKGIVEVELITPVISAVESAISMSETGITFNEIKFLETLEHEVSRIDFSIEDENWRRLNLCHVLIKTNFNDRDFIKFYTSHVENSLLHCETLSDRIEQVGYFYKLVNQIFLIQGVGFHSSERHVKLQLLEWISYELDYLNQRHLLQLPAKGADLIKKDFKIIFDLSVSQLGYLFKLLIETGLIQNKNASEVIRFLSKFVKTKKAESVSYESLRIKFYNTESGTKDAVRKTFQSLLSYINKN